MNNNNCLKFSTFIQYCLLYSFAAWTSIIFQQWWSYRRFSATTFYVMKNICTENLQLHKITWVWNDIDKTSDSAFTLNVRCLPRLLHKPSVALQTQMIWRHVALLLRLYALFWLLPKNYWVIVLEICVTRDVISSNLVFVIWTLCRCLLPKFLNAQKLLRGHTKGFVTELWR